MLGLTFGLQQRRSFPTGRAPEGQGEDGNGDGGKGGDNTSHAIKNLWDLKGKE